MWFTIIYFVGVIIIYKVYDYFKWKRIAKDILGEELLKQIDKKSQLRLTLARAPAILHKNIPALLYKLHN